MFVVDQEYIYIYKHLLSNIFPNFLNFPQIPLFVHIAESLFVCHEFLRNYFWGARRLSELNPPFILLYFPLSLPACLSLQKETITLKQTESGLVPEEENSFKTAGDLRFTI